MACSVTAKLDMPAFKLHACSNLPIEHPPMKSLLNTPETGMSKLYRTLPLDRPVHAHAIGDPIQVQLRATLVWGIHCAGESPI